MLNFRLDLFIPESPGSCRARFVIVNCGIVLANHLVDTMETQQEILRCLTRRLDLAYSPDLETVVIFHLNAGRIPHRHPASELKILVFDAALIDSRVPRGLLRNERLWRRPVLIPSFEYHIFLAVN